MFELAQFSKAGRKVANQDRVLCCRSGDWLLLAVADGMGGVGSGKAGAVASHIAVHALRGDRLKLMSKDQTELQHLIDMGVLNEEQAEHYPNRHILFSALMSHVDFELSELEFTVEIGDRLFLSSDGIHDLLSARELAAVLCGAGSLGGVVAATSTAVEAKGVHDDYSLLACEIAEAGGTGGAGGSGRIAGAGGSGGNGRIGSRA